MGAWFTRRPDALFLARWEGDEAAVAADQAAGRLAARLELEVQPGGELRVVDPVLGRSFDVPVGSWFTERQRWEDDQLHLVYQEVTVGDVADGEVPVLAYAVTGAS